MTRIILESNNYNDVNLIKKLADRLKIKYEIRDIAERINIEKNSEKWALLNKSIDISNYGDPSKWQKDVRKSRDLDLSL